MSVIVRQQKAKGKTMISISDLVEKSLKFMSDLHNKYYSNNFNRDQRVIDVKDCIAVQKLVDSLLEKIKDQQWRKIKTQFPMFEGYMILVNLKNGKFRHGKLYYFSKTYGHPADFDAYTHFMYFNLPEEGDKSHD